jgi:hypothetical protein
MNARFLPVLVILLGATGCASIISGTTQEVSFHSNPEGATVTVDGKTLGSTPLAFPLKKSKYREVVFQKDGYKTLTLPMESRLNGWFWGNILFGGLVGSTTDGISGAANEYSPGQFMVSLEPSNASPIERETVKSDEQKAREFIIIAYGNLVPELASGQGEYLRSLMDVLKIPAERRPEAIKKLKALSDVYSDIPDFADHAVELYMKPGAAAPSAAGAQTPLTPVKMDVDAHHCPSGEEYKYGQCYPVKPLIK